MQTSMVEIVGIFTVMKYLKGLVSSKMMNMLAFARN
jgi:hypothetical protein